MSYKVAASALVMAAAASAALAADVQTLQTSGERMEADNAPMGIRAGAFLVIPKMDVKETYNDNIYSTNTNTKSDFVTTVAPEVAVKSNWSRHALNAKVSTEINKFSSHSHEDTTNTFVGMDGRVDVMRDTSVGGGVSWTRAHEDRGDPNSNASATKPTQFDTTTAKLGAYRSLGRMNARLDTQVDHINYKNGQTTAGALINNNARDRNEFTHSLRLGYVLNDRAEAYVKGSINDRVYDTKAPLNRSSRGKAIAAGAVFDITGKTKGDVHAGVEKRNYRASNLKDLTKPMFGASVTWNATELTSIIAGIDRSIEETTLSAANSGYLNTSYHADVEHALTRKALLTAGLDYSTQSYKGTGTNLRDDKVWTAKAGAKYYINHYLKAGAEYSYRDRNSNVAGGDFSRNTLMVMLTGTY